MSAQFGSLRLKAGKKKKTVGYNIEWHNQDAKGMTF
jgi:hypothetical protein